MYSERVTRANKGCLVFLLDQSFSMTEGIAGSPKRKSETMATAINRFLSELVVKCQGDDEEPRDYFDVGVVGYTTDQTGRPIIGPAFQGGLAFKELVTVPELFNSPLRIEDRTKKVDDGAGGLIDQVIKLPIWYDPPADSAMAGTPMCGALEYVLQILRPWCDAHFFSFPPIVIHITDGESQDGNPEAIAESLKSIATNDGQLLLFNCHLSSLPAQSLEFPTREDDLADEFARLLYRMSSPLPDLMVKNAEVFGLSIRSGARGMVFNADATKLIQMINVGTLVAHNLR